VKKRLSIIFAVLIISSLVFPITIQAGSLSGGWDNELTLKPNGSMVHGYGSKLQVNYTQGRMDFSSTSKFGLSKFKKQKFGFGYSFANFSLDIDSKFSPSSRRLSKASGTATVSLMGITFSDELELKYNSGSGKYDTTSTFIAVGGISNGVTTKLTTVFGGKGTGAGLGYNSTKWEFWNINFGCTSFSIRTDFSISKGFKKTKAEFDINPPSLPFNFSGKLVYKASQKSVSLTPSLSLGGSCVDIYGGFDWDQPEIKGLIVKGFGLSGIPLGPATFSSYVTLGKYNVHDINDNYKNGYDQVISLSADGGIGLTLDIYGNSNSGGLLGMSLFEGSSSVSVLEDLSFGMSVEMGFADSNKGWKEATFSVDYNF